jgi:hypothetical protein
VSTVYATAAFVRGYLSDDATALLPEEDADVEGLIALAELAVDRVMSARLTPSTTTGRKLTPAALNAAQKIALERATAAAVEEIVLLGPSTLAELDDGTKLAGSIVIEGPPARPPGPSVREELSGFGFPVRSGTVAPAPEPEDGLVG